MSKRSEEAKAKLITRTNPFGEDARERLDLAVYATVDTTAWTWTEIKDLHNFALDYMINHRDEFAGFGFCTASNPTRSVARFCNDQEI